MKTIEQLLELSKNPYYVFTKNEKVVLDDFLSKKQAPRLAPSQSKNSEQSDKNTNVHVRNIVPKTIDRLEDAPEPTDVLQDAF